MQIVFAVLVGAVVILVPGGLVGVAAVHSIKKWKKRRKEDRAESNNLRISHGKTGST